jgi:beta-glucosidase
MKNRLHFLVSKGAFAFLFICLFCNVNAQEEVFKTVTNKNGPTLGYSPASGVKILTINGLNFKDLNKNGKLDKYEDWRLPVDVRAKDLASQMSIEEIAGLMLYSSHQVIPSTGGFGPLGAATYNGKKFAESGSQPWDLSDQQKKFLTTDNLRHVLLAVLQNSEVAARWNNNAQALVEGLGFGIPVNNSSDPRNGVVANTEYNLGAAGKISMWPEELGMAATFDPALVEKFGQIASKEYRALGIATALSPRSTWVQSRDGAVSMERLVKIQNSLQIWQEHMLMDSKHQPVRMK